MSLEPAGFNSLELAGWIGSLFFLAGGLNQVLRLTDRFKEQPPPGQTYATKEELHLLRADLNHLRAEVREDRDRILQAGEERARKLHERIDPIVNEMPGKIIELLHNTGALR